MEGDDYFTGDAEYNSDKVWTRTWYGRGEPMSAAETERHLRKSFAIAKSKWSKVWVAADEDAYFTPFSDDEQVFDGPIESADGAMRAWWLGYGSCQDRSLHIQLGFRPWIERYGPGMTEENLDPGWQIGVTRTGMGPSDYTTEVEERTAMEAAGIDPQERIDMGVWIAAIPSEWAKQATADDADGRAEEGVYIQECNAHEVIGPDGAKWTIEIPLP